MFHMGLIAAEFEKEYPHIDEMHEFPPVLLDEPLLPTVMVWHDLPSRRLLLADSTTTKVIQLQRDRLFFNYRSIDAKHIAFGIEDGFSELKAVYRKLNEIFRDR
jgi:hypothetical protein